MKQVAILQSNYIPWKGYFDLIARVDEFIVYDDVQFTRRDWRNRNMIKTPAGTQWLTVPVRNRGRYLQQIRETEIDGQAWQASHWKALQMNYAKAKHFDDVAALLAPAYEASYANLTELNVALIRRICDYLGLRTQITYAWDYDIAATGKTEKLVDLCVRAGATGYLSGPSAQSYIDESLFTDAGIALSWMDYGGYPEYPQLWGDFVHAVSVVDLLFNCGGDAANYMRHVRR